MTADQLPGGGASPEDTGIEALLSSEAKARLNAVRAQIKRVDKVFTDLRAKGINVTEITIKKGESYYSVLRDSTWHDNLNANEEFLYINTPPAVDESDEFDISAYLGIDPVVTNDPGQITYKNKYKRSIEAISFDSALQGIASLLDELGFLSIDEPALGSGDVDGNATSKPELRLQDGYMDPA